MILDAIKSEIEDRARDLVDLDNSAQSLLQELSTYRDELRELTITLNSARELTRTMAIAYHDFEYVVSVFYLRQLITRSLFGGQTAGMPGLTNLQVMARATSTRRECDIFANDQIGVKAEIPDFFHTPAILNALLGPLIPATIHFAFGVHLKADSPSVTLAHAAVIRGAPFYLNIDDLTTSLTITQDAINDHLRNHLDQIKLSSFENLNLGSITIELLAASAVQHLTVFGRITAPRGAPPPKPTIPALEDLLSQFPPYIHSDFDLALRVRTSIVLSQIKQGLATVIDEINRTELPIGRLQGSGARSYVGTDRNHPDRKALFAHIHVEFIIEIIFDVTFWSDDFDVQIEFRLVQVDDQQSPHKNVVMYAELFGKSTEVVILRNLSNASVAAESWIEDLATTLFVR